MSFLRHFAHAYVQQRGFRHPRHPVGDPHARLGPGVVAIRALRQRSAARGTRLPVRGDRLFSILPFALPVLALILIFRSASGSSELGLSNEGDRAWRMDERGWSGH